jgi:DEAD/DEAH box helicase domain-containing protein
MSKSAVDKFKEDIRFRDKIAHIETIPGKEAEYYKVDDLDSNFISYLESKGIKLYKHQAESINHIRDGENIIITTPTASGKTLAFNIPVLETLNRDKNATALYIYPAKALSYDQLDVLKNLEEGLNININPATYDGDTPKSSRYNIRQKSRIVLTNPYQLHHILAWHHQWKRFYSNLKYIVIDESHYYKGIFGSNVAFLIRRLKRICKFYNSNPQFILSSATLANPKELAERLTGEKFSLISEDTSPSGDKDFILYNPYKNVNKKKNNNAPSIHQETEYIFLFLLLKDVQTLCFTVSRKIAELIAMWAKNDMLQYKRQLTSRITAYRAGYLAEERREIEEGLKSGKYLGVTCTNALELGINIGSLDAVIISGYPGTMISVWQQGGRAGRGTSKSLVILVAFENQLDQYFMKNPNFFFDKPHENVVIDLNNPILIKSHLVCAANELPFDKNEAEEYFNANSSLLNEIVNEKEVSVSNGLYTYPYDDSPSFTHSLDQLSDDLFKVVNNHRLLEVLERSQMYREAHPGAVLINKGETYIVDNVNLKSNFVNVIKHKVNYHTSVLKNVNINIISKIRREEIGDFTVHFGELEVSEDYHHYKKIQFSKTVGSYILDLPPLNFRTKGLWFTIPDSVKDKL